MDVSQIATNRRMTVKYNPPSSCILEISVKGIKLSVQEDYYACDRVRLPLSLCRSNSCKTNSVQLHQVLSDNGSSFMLNS